MMPSIAVLDSAREIRPLSGAASSGGPEKALHDAAFDALRERGSSWRVFGEVPTHGGVADLVAIRFYDVGQASESAALLRSATALTVSDLSSIRLGVGYCWRTLSSRFQSQDLDELLEIEVLKESGSLLYRTKLPSDLISTVEAYEIKASAYSEGVVQAALRSPVAHRSWLVMPSKEAFARLGIRATRLIDTLGVGVVTPTMTVLKRGSARPRPPRSSGLNLLMRSVALQRERQV